jgi:D-tyrosyl-tRNA(Tyr) deacylase
METWPWLGAARRLAGLHARSGQATNAGVMRAVVQRVTRAKVTVGDRVTGAIEAGLLVLLGAGHGDTAADLGYIVDKIVHLRIFADAAGKMNRSVLEVGGGVLVVSQFTLYGDARQGRRPAFTGALEPVAARALYDQALVALQQAGITQVQAGEFAADMAVDLTNAGPVTILLDSRKGF